MREEGQPGPVVGLLLAGGAGRRFAPDGSRNKLLALIDGTPVIARAAAHLAEACDRSLAIVPPGSEALRAALARTAIDEVIDCPEAARGMGHTLACGARAAAGAGARRIVVALADMPWIRPGTIRALIAAAGAAEIAADAIVVPVHDGHRGHPVVFGATHLPGLAACSGDRGAQALLARHPVIRLPVDDAGVIRDVDTPADLERPANAS